MDPKPTRFTRSSRKHRIGRASARQVIASAVVDVSADPETGDVTLTWIGNDERERELEIVALDRTDCILVIHVMPTQYRRRSR